MSTATDGRGLRVWHYPLPLPEADARRLIKGFETLGGAQAELAHRAKLLRRGNHEQRRLAGKLEGCRKGRRCELSICPLCKRRERLWIIGQTMALTVNDDPAFVTVVTVKGIFEAGELDEADPNRLRNQLRQQLLRCGYLGLAVGEIHGAYDPERHEYSVHIHFIASGLDLKPFERLRAFYPPTHTGSAGLVIYGPPLKHRPSVIGYCFKSFWSQRPWYPDKSRKIRPKKRRLPPEQELEWLTWQAQYAPASLLFLYRVRRRGDTLCRLGKAPDSEVQPNGPALRRAR